MMDENNKKEDGPGLQAFLGALSAIIVFIVGIFFISDNGYLSLFRLFAVFLTSAVLKSGNSKYKAFFKAMFRTLLIIFIIIFVGVLCFFGLCFIGGY